MTTVALLHQQLQERLNFPDYHGRNLDALWDYLHYVDLSWLVRWFHFTASQQHLGDYADQTLQTFQEAQAELSSFVLEVL